MRRCPPRPSLSSMAESLSGGKNEQQRSIVHVSNCPLCASCSHQALLNPLLNPLLNCCCSCSCCCTLSYQAPPLSTEHDELPSSPAAAHAEPASAAAAALQMPHAMRAPQLPSSLRPAAILSGSPNTLLPPPIAAPTRAIPNRARACRDAEAHPKVVLVAAAQVHNVACSVCLPLTLCLPLLHPLRECIICLLQLLEYCSGDFEYTRLPVVANPAFPY